MKIVIDADNCPVRAEVADVASRSGLEVVMVCGPSNLIPESPSTRVIQVGDRPDAADFAIVGLAEEGDIVVTSDIGLAAIVLSKGVRALTPRGDVLQEKDMTAALEVRHLHKKLRRAGVKTPGPKRFTQEDRKRFRAALSRLVAELRDAGTDAQKL